ncbi:hypothetical protein BDW59DRAFT_145504 [Aspergillus cavernicola]|uniref:Uncharacterized protein n=1 Tax=Aspergillus cavernicola TaxID=176166 RepID=A0ABR4IEG5_9EURO
MSEGFIWFILAIRVHPGVARVHSRPFRFLLVRRNGPRILHGRIGEHSWNIAMEPVDAKRVLAFSGASFQLLPKAKSLGANGCGPIVDILTI